MGHKPQLYRFQEIGSQFLQDRTVAMLADEMGLGKTVQVADALRELDQRHVLIICPASLKTNWQRELAQWYPDLKTHVVYGTKATIPLDAEAIIINYDLITHRHIYYQLISAPYYTTLVMDEAHYLKTPESKRTKLLFTKGGLASRCKRKWFVTGTPIINRPVELYPILRACAPHVIDPYVSYDAFVKHFCGGYYDNRTHRYVAKGATHKEEMNKRLISSGIMLRRLKKHVWKEMPKKTFQLVSIKAKTKRVVTKVEKVFSWLREDASYQTLKQDGSNLATQHRELAEEKIPYALDYIKVLMLQTQKLVIFAHHRVVIEALQEALGEEFGAVSIYGGTPAKDRQKHVDQFQDNPDTQIFIGQIQAAGTGITLTAAHQVLFVEPTWVPGQIDQAVDRVHRIGQTMPINVRFMVWADSVEEHMMRTVIEKKMLIHQLVEDHELNEMLS